MLMGRPSKIKALPAGTSRRGFFKQAGGAAAAATVGPMMALSGVTHAAAPLFQHGVASGDPLFDRVILWTRASPTAGRSVVIVSYVVAIDPGMTQVVQRGSVKTNPARDYTVKVDVTGLVPNNTYYYRFTADGETSPIGRTKTLPVGSTPRLRMAVVSCSNHAYGFFNVYARIAQRADLDLVMHLGDYLYEYGANQYGTARTPEPAVEIITLNDYRSRHAQYKRDADSQAMHRQHPLVCIWDDHETADNAWKDGAENHTPGTEGAWAARVDAALQAYYEWMPVRVVDTANYRKNNRSYTYGDLAEFVLLEQRLTGRSEQLGTNIGNASGYFIQAGPYLDSARQLLGVTQEAWLFDKLRTANARWKLLGQGVMFAQLKVRGGANAAGGGVYFNSDAWDGYQPARDRVFEVIKGGNGQPAVNNVVVLTGDIHSSWAADLTQDPNNADVASGGYDAATGAGSRAVEFVGTSVSSPGVADPTGAIASSLLPANPHFKYINLDKRGYMIVDVTHQRALAEWWFVDTVAAPSSNESFGVAFATVSGSNRLVSASQTTPPLNPPALAP
jgi:alkaline phosphatase D